MQIDLDPQAFIAETPFPAEGELRVGSFSARLSATRPDFCERLAWLFKQQHRPGDEPRWNFYLAGVPQDDPLFASPLPPGVLATWLCRVYIGSRDVLFLISEPQAEAYQTADLSVAVQKVLLALGQCYLHAGAVSIRGQTFLVAGPRGAGKSTLCLRLAQAGGSLVSDDHVLLRRAEGGYRVSGCETTARVTAQSEQYLFPHGLGVQAADYHGVVKKEFDAARYVDFRPLPERPFHRIMFPHVGERVRQTPLPAALAVTRLIHMKQADFVYVNGSEVAAFMDFLADLVETTPCVDLELSPNLGDLDALVAAL
ncbi:MAG TPA: hypothetical protein VGO93_21925 [Candidatus Xenobia bacterium]|jgi:hypothetical protein